MDEAFVYLWYDAGWKQTGGPRYYIGKHKGGLDSGYVCSSKHMKPEWEERGCKHKGCTHLFGEDGHHGDFHRRVLSYGSEEEMIDFEIKLLTRREKYFSTRYYNRVVVWCSALSGEDNPAYKHGKYGTKEYFREASLKYRLNNKEKVAEKDRKYKVNNKDKIKKYNTKYYLDNKDRIKLQRLQKEKTSEQ